MVIWYIVDKTRITCLPVIKHSFDTIAVVSTDKEWCSIDSSKFKCWKPVQPPQIGYIIGIVVFLVLLKDCLVFSGLSKL